MAKFSYAASLIVEKEWATGDYLLSHAARAAAVSEHFGCHASVISVNKSGVAAVKAAVKADLDRRMPLKLQIASVKGGSTQHWHHVVIDNYKIGQNEALLMHLNVGHSGADDGW